LEEKSRPVSKPNNIQAHSKPKISREKSTILLMYHRLHQQSTYKQLINTICFLLDRFIPREPWDFKCWFWCCRVHEGNKYWFWYLRFHGLFSFLLALQHCWNLVGICLSWKQNKNKKNLALSNNFVPFFLVLAAFNIRFASV